MACFVCCLSLTVRLASCCVQYKQPDPSHDAYERLLPSYKQQVLDEQDVAAHNDDDDDDDETSMGHHPPSSCTSSTLQHREALDNVSWPHAYPPPLELLPVSPVRQWGADSIDDNIEQQS